MNRTTPSAVVESARKAVVLHATAKDLMIRVIALRSEVDEATTFFELMECAMATAAAAPSQLVGSHHGN